MVAALQLTNCDPPKHYSNSTNYYSQQVWAQNDTKLIYLHTARACNRMGLQTIGEIRSAFLGRCFPTVTKADYPPVPWRHSPRQWQWPITNAATNVRIKIRTRMRQLAAARPLDRSPHVCELVRKDSKLCTNFNLLSSLARARVLILVMKRLGLRAHNRQISEKTVNNHKLSRFRVSFQNRLKLSSTAQTSECPKWR